MMSKKELSHFLKTTGGLVYANGNLPNPIEMFGIECDDGWLQMIADLIAELIDAGWTREIMQIKEKFGGLCFYAAGLNNNCKALIAKYEKRSYEIYERCGSTDKVKLCGDHWVKTLCDQCEGPGKDGSSGLTNMMLMNDHNIDEILKYKQICLHLNMTAEFESYKGIHPGKVIERLLNKRNISQRPFALALPEHPQTFNAILKGKRNLNIGLALKIERALNLEEGSLMTLQVHFDLKIERLRTQGPGPDLPVGLFWDVDIKKIDWEKKYKFVIKRVYERGDKQEREVINNFYGLDKVNEVIASRTITESGNLAFMPQTRR